MSGGEVGGSELEESKQGGAEERPLLKVYDDLERKKVAHENLLREWMENGEQSGCQGGESTVSERERARRRRLQQDREVDIKGSIVSSSGHGVVADQ